MQFGRIRLSLLLAILCIVFICSGCRALLGYPPWARNENAATALVAQDLKKKATNPEVKEGLEEIEVSNTKTADAMGGPTKMINKGNARKVLRESGEQAEQAASSIWGMLGGLLSWENLLYLGIILLTGGGGLKIGGMVVGKKLGGLQGAFDVMSSVLARKQDKTPGSMDEIFHDIKWEAKSRGQYDNVKTALAKGGNESEPARNGFHSNDDSQKGESNGV